MDRLERAETKTNVLLYLFAIMVALVGWLSYMMATYYWR
jgi:hypothetical protein